MDKQLTLTNEFLKAKPVLERLINKGYEAYFVGGSVRDALLGLDVNDMDIASSAQPQEVKAIFSKTVDVGIDHGTVMVLHQDEGYEITTFRTESTYKDYRRPDSVSFVRSLEEDLKRRDFTINAIAVDKDGYITDLFDGLHDLDQNIIRAVGKADERFNEDALRMMRAVRFSGQLGFEIEADTLAAIKDHGELLEKIAVERINIEWVKLLVSKDRQQALKSMVESRLYEFCPKLANKKLALVYLANREDQLTNERQAWAALLYYIRFIQPKGHQEDIARFLKAWKTSNQMIDEVKTLVYGLEIRVESKAVDAFELYQTGLDLSLEIENLMTFIGEESQADQVKALYQDLPIKSRQDLNLTGYDLMQELERKPGPWLGEALALAERQVVKCQWPNDRDQLIQLVKEAVT